MTQGSAELDDLKSFIDSKLKPQGQYIWGDPELFEHIIEHEATKKLAKSKARVFRSKFPVEFAEYEIETLATDVRGKLWERLPKYKYPPLAPFKYSFRKLVNYCFHHLQREVRRGRSSRQVDGPEATDGPDPKCDPSPGVPAYELLQIAVDAAHAVGGQCAVALVWWLTENPGMQPKVVAGRFRIPTSTFHDARGRLKKRVGEVLRELAR